jgi:hypothetical protein
VPGCPDHQYAKRSVLTGGAMPTCASPSAAWRYNPSRTLHALALQQHDVQ